MSKNVFLVMIFLPFLLFSCSSVTEKSEKDNPAVRSRAAALDWLELTGTDAWQENRDEWMLVGAVSLSPQDDSKFAFEVGESIWVNGLDGKTVDLHSSEEYGDMECHIDFMVPRGSNSGVYFQSRYEIQIFDSWQVAEPKYSDCGGVYQRWRDGKGFEGHAPRVNASRPPGEWQSFDIVFRAPRFDTDGNKTENARFVKIVHNGEVVHENVELTGPTRAASFEDEAATGPLMIQGDHGPVAFKNVRIKRLKLD